MLIFSINLNKGQAGIWQGFLIALELPVTLIPPQTWQAAHALYHWQARLKEDPSIFTPLTYARRLWPDAPLEFQADDGQAVGLLLAALAVSDDLRGIDPHRDPGGGPRKEAEEETGSQEAGQGVTAAPRPRSRCRRVLRWMICCPAATRSSTFSMKRRRSEWSGA